MDRFEVPCCDAASAVDGSIGLFESDAAGTPFSAGDDARRLIKTLGVGARQKVAASEAAQYGSWLGWPGWLVHGTSLPVGRQLPDNIALVDNLVLIANLVDSGVAASIIKRLLEDFKIPGAPISVPALYNAPTLRAALAFFVRSTALGSPYLNVELRPDRDRFSIIIDSGLSRGPLRDFSALAVLCVAYRFVGFFAEDRMPELGIDVETGHDSLLIDPFRKLPVTISAGAQRYALHGPGTWLSIKNARPDKAFWHFALERLAVAERAANRSDIVVRIREAIASSMHGECRVPRLKQVAVLHGVSERTLVRMLAAQGVKFHQIVEEERRIKAAELIGNGSVSLSEIAHALGFTDMSSFGRSYRQWFGITPGQARNRMRA